MKAAVEKEVEFGDRKREVDAAGEEGEGSGVGGRWKGEV